jgi:hypothetical protein
VLRTVTSSSHFDAAIACTVMAGRDPDIYPTFSSKLHGRHGADGRLAGRP